MNNVLNELDGSKGYYCEYRMSDKELSIYRDTVSSHYFDVLIESSQYDLHKFEEIPITRYHEQADSLDHQSLWSKKNRILPPKYLMNLKATPFFEFIYKEFGIFKITGEDGVYEEEIYWRLVRPDSAQDVGPLHADSWFWALAGEEKNIGRRDRKSVV